MKEKKAKRFEVKSEQGLAGGAIHVLADTETGVNDIALRKPRALARLSTGLY